MAVVFLIGGTGNQIFQYSSSDRQDVFSTILLNNKVRRCLRWTNHEQIFKYASPPILLHMLTVFVVAVDFLLISSIGISLFTEFDTRGIKARPRLGTLAKIGYFQEMPMRRSLAPLVAQIVAAPGRGVIAIHVRGGDLLSPAGRATYGIPSDAYYRAGVEIAVAEITQNGGKVEQVIVLTDDPEHAATLDLAVAGAPTPDIMHCELSDTLARALGACWFVSSNSTLAYWIVHFRQGLRCIAPVPFQERRDFRLPAAARRIALAHS